MDMQKIGRYAFIAGLLISVLAGLMPMMGMNIGYMGLAALVVLGVVVGILNVTGKEVQPFLLGTIALMIVGTLGVTLGTQSVRIVLEKLIGTYK